nr:Ig-like domain-containing protein [Herbaspirillum sp. ASV7]
MSNDHSKAATNPVANKQLGDVPVQSIMPAARRIAAVPAKGGRNATGKGALSRSDEQQVRDEQTLLDAAVVNAEDKQASADAAMSVRRKDGHEDEQEATASNLPGEGGDARASQDEVLQLAQANTSSATPAASTDGPGSVGEELLRQAAPVPVSAPAAQAKATGFEAWLKSDWALPVAIGGGALALLGLAAAGGGGGGATSKESQTPAAAASNNVVADAIPENMYGLTVTPAAGPFNAGAAVRVSVQKRMADGSWSEVASSSTVDATGRMQVLVEKKAVSANDMLRLVLTDSKPNENDYNDEVSGQQSLGNVVLQAVIGGLSGNTAVTVNPLTTLAAKLIGADFSAAHVKAVNAAVAAAFGLRDGDLILTIPALLTSPSAADAPPAAVNYGLALGIVSGMTQAQRDAHAADPLQATLDALAKAPMNPAADGSLSLDLSGLRQLSVTVPNSNDKVAVGLDAGAARLYGASAANGNIAGAQVPYVQVDPKSERPAAGQVVPGWSKAAIRFSDFIDGLTIKVAPAVSAKVGDTLIIEFLPLDKAGVPLPGLPTFTFQHIYTKSDADQVYSSRMSSENNSVGNFTVVVPTYDSYYGQAQPSSSNPQVYLFGVDGQKHYNFAAGNIGGYQMRATGAVVGLLGAGSNFSVDATPISTQSGSMSGSTTINGESNSSGSNVIRVKLVLPKGIQWEGADPTLKLLVTDAAGASREVIANADLTSKGQMIKGGGIWNFQATLSNSQEATKGLDGALRIPADALQFAPGTKLFDQFGNLLYTNDGGSWRDASNALVDNIQQALGVTTALANTGFKVDTTRPATPILNFTNLPSTTFDSEGYVRVDGGAFPAREKPNATPKGAAGFAAFDLVTTNMKQDFTVTFDNGAVSPNDVGDTVFLLAKASNKESGTTILQLRVGSTKIIRDPDGSYKARFGKDDYNDEIKRFNDAALKFPMKVEFFVQVLDQAGNTSGEPVPLQPRASGGAVNNVYLDLAAPAAPSVGLAADSDTGRVGAAETRSDNITSIVKPAIHVTGDLGTMAVVRDNNDQVVLSKWLISNSAGSNAADLAIPTALPKGPHNFTVTLVDAAGNASPPSSLTITVLPAQDQSTPLPVVSITSTPARGGFYIVGDDITGQVTFEREVYLKQGAQRKLSLNLGDINVNSTPLNVELVDGFGTKTLTFKHKVVASDLNTSSGLTRASLVNADQLEDVAGSPINSLAATNFSSPSVPQLIDTYAPPPPTLAVVADIATHQGKASKVTAQGGALTVAAEAGTQVELSFTGSAGRIVTKSVQAAAGNAGVPVPLTQAEIDQLGDGQVSVTATARDQATNRSQASVPVTFTLDGTAPSAMAGSATPKVATNLPISFTVKFSETLNREPLVGDFQATYGEVQSVVAAGSDKPNQYVVTVKPQDGVAGGGAGKVQLSLSAAGLGLTDQAGNPMASTGVLAEQAIDTQGPMVVSVKKAVAPEASTPLPKKSFDWIVTFNEKIDQIDQGNLLKPENFTVSGGSNVRVTDVTPFGNDGTQYKVTVNPGSLSGNNNPITLGLRGFVIDGGTVLDKLGNRNPGQPDLSNEGGARQHRCPGPQRASGSDRRCQPARYQPPCRDVLPCR